MRSSGLVRGRYAQYCCVGASPSAFPLADAIHWHTRHNVCIASDMTCILSLHQRRGQPPGSKRTEQFACQVENQRASPLKSVLKAKLILLDNFRFAVATKYHLQRESSPINNTQDKYTGFMHFCIPGHRVMNDRIDGVLKWSCFQSGCSCHRIEWQKCTTELIMALELTQTGPVF
jgi:hypothetical protein